MKNDLKNIYYRVTQKYRIDNKTTDITAGTPFINLTGAGNNETILINVSVINRVSPFAERPEYTEIYINEEYIVVKETPAEILELIKNKYI